LLKADDIHPPLDLAFIDGDHSFEAVKKDLATVEPWIKSGGTLAFHDFGTYEGVQRVVGSALQSGVWHIGGLVDSLVWLRRVPRPAATESETPQGAAAAT
jgi:Methyltransferase domain